MSLAEIDTRISSKTHRGVDKIEHYKWQVKDGGGTFAYVPKDSIQIDHQHYQRDNISNWKVLELARDWSWVACGTLCIARRRDGSLWAMDGQYRLMASLRRSDIRDLPCMIFDVHDVKEEARGFINVNTNRKPPMSLAKYKAQITAGDEDVIFVRDLLESTNRVIGNRSKKEVVCVGSLVWWARKDRDALIRIWPVLDALSPDSTVPIQLADGMMFLERAMDRGESLSDVQIRARLIQIGAEELVHEARASARYHGKGGGKVWADGIRNRYNKGLQRKLPVRLGALTF
jgi:hypothetical protein